MAPTIKRPTQPPITTVEWFRKCRLRKPYRALGYVLTRSQPDRTARFTPRLSESRIPRTMIRVTTPVLRIVTR
jgi:hypothetical protein